MPKKKKAGKKNPSRKDLLGMFHEVGSFCCGLATARKGDEWFHIKRDGKPAYPERYKEVGNFECSLAWVEDFEGNRFQINKEGVRQD